MFFQGCAPKMVGGFRIEVTSADDLASSDGETGASVGVVVLICSTCSIL